MKRIVTKSIVLNVPVEYAYNSIVTTDSSRYTGDLSGAWESGFSKAIPNAFLVFCWKDNVGRYIINEITFHKINDSACELAMNICYDHFDSAYIGLILAQMIHGFMLLDATFKQKR